jgi:hypothetical protein
MQQFLETAVKGLVDHPDSVSVTPVERGGMVTYEVRVAEGDAGKVIGKQGSMIQVLRNLLAVGGAKFGKRTAIELVDE